MIAGWIGDEHGGERYFAGWLELLILLEQARQMTTPVRPITPGKG